MKTRCWVAAVLATLALQPALAQEEESDTGWSDTADFSFVLTSGNSDTETLGFNNLLTRKWQKAEFSFKLGALKAENTTKFAVRNGNSLEIQEATEKTAENYYATLAYQRDISKRTFWYVGGGWLRNEFAGIQDRYTATAGVGNKWIDKEGLQFSTTYGASYTDQQDVVEVVPEIDRSYPGIILGWKYLNDWGKSATYTNDLIFNYNLEESEDWRWVMEQAVTVTMTKKLALKVSLLWLYNNVPAFEEYTVPDDMNPATEDSLLVQLDELDSIFGVSLVVNF